MNANRPTPGRTRGRWRVDFPRIIADDARETIVCEVTGAEANPIARADAVFIAAAPDVAEKAREYLAALENWTGQGMPDCPTTVACADAHAALVEALDKAGA
jgi:hypothetical protein